MPAYNYYNVPSWQPVQPYPQPYPQQSFGISVPQAPQQFMINVDGEIGAKAWQPQTPLAPNSVIPLWDFDGIHVYFKSTDAYGRMNPMRKAKVVFEDEQKALPQGNSGAVNGLNENANQNVSGAQSIELPDMAKYVTKDDLESLKQDLRSMFTAQAISGQSHPNPQLNQANQQNQNGNDFSQKRGGRN